MHEDENSGIGTGMSLHPKSRAREHAPSGCTLLMFSHRSSVGALGQAG